MLVIWISSQVEQAFYRYWSLHVNYEYLALNFLLQLCLPLWVPHKLTSFNTILEPSNHTWIPCSSIFLSHSSLSHTMITNWDIHNCLQYMSYIISQIKYLLIISHKQVSPSIMLLINTPKLTRGLDVLSPMHETTLTKAKFEDLCSELLERYVLWLLLWLGAKFRCA